MSASGGETTGLSGSGGSSDEPAFNGALSGSAKVTRRLGAVVAVGFGVGMLFA